MFFPAFYFPATGKIKGAYDTSSLTTAVAPALAGAAPPAGNKKTSINLTQSKGDLPAQEWGRCTAEPSLSSFWWAQVSALAMQEKELKASLPHTSHLWDTNITLKANEQSEHGLCQPPLNYRSHTETHIAAPDTSFTAPWTAEEKAWVAREPGLLHSHTVSRGSRLE